MYTTNDDERCRLRTFPHESWCFERGVIVCQSAIMGLSLYWTLLHNNNCDIHFSAAPLTNTVTRTSLVRNHQSPGPHPRSRARLQLRMGVNGQKEVTTIDPCQCKIDFYTRHRVADPPPGIIQEYAAAAMGIFQRSTLSWHLPLTVYHPPTGTLIKDNVTGIVFFD